VSFSDFALVDRQANIFVLLWGYRMDGDDGGPNVASAGTYIGVLVSTA
jgi:hypothetical protein